MNQLVMCLREWTGGFKSRATGLDERLSFLSTFRLVSSLSQYNFLQKCIFCDTLH